MAKGKTAGKRGNGLTHKTIARQEYYEKRGYIVADVERRIPHTFITQDMYGVFDLVATGHNRIVGVQVTDNTNFSKRRVKVLESRLAYTWVENGGEIEIIGVKKTSLGNIFRVEQLKSEDFQCSFFNTKGQHELRM